MDSTSRKRARSPDDVGTGPPRRAFMAGRGAAAGMNAAAAPFNPTAASFIPSNPVVPGNSTRTSQNDTESFNYMSDPIKIRNQHGARTIATWSRRNLLLFLRGVNAPANAVGQRLDLIPAYTDAAASALREADQPQGIMDLTRLGGESELERVLGNKEAGRLFEAIYTHTVVNTGTSRGSQIRDMVRCLPTDPTDNTKRLSRRLEILTGPDPYKARWAWRLLRDSCRTWLDVRARSLRESGWYDDEGNPPARGANALPGLSIPLRLAQRVQQVNALVHGPDVRLDAFMCQLQFASQRTYPREPITVAQQFQMINVPLGKLAEHGLELSNGVHWPSLVATINLYVWTRFQILRSRPLTGSIRNYTGLTYKDIHRELFLEGFIRSVVDLINAAKALPRSAGNVSQDLIDKAFTWRNTLYTVCQGWTEHDDRLDRSEIPKRFLRPIWHRYDRFTDGWWPGQDIISNRSYNEANEVWLCSDSKAPETQPINVQALLEAYGNGPPQDWRGPRTLNDARAYPNFAGTGHPPGTLPPNSQRPPPNQSQTPPVPPVSNTRAGASQTDVRVASWAQIAQGAARRGRGQGGGDQGQGAGAGARGNRDTFTVPLRPPP